MCLLSNKTNQPQTWERRWFYNQWKTTEINQSNRWQIMPLQIWSFPKYISLIEGRWNYNAVEGDKELYLRTLFPRGGFILSSFIRGQKLVCYPVLYSTVKYMAVSQPQHHTQECSSDLGGTSCIILTQVTVTGVGTRTPVHFPVLVKTKWANTGESSSSVWNWLHKS